jgi:dsDNA-binding SOS-regulon protein
MFIGAINKSAKSVLKELSAGWRGQDVYVGCSGNFTVERILNSCGIENIHSNDVSLYSCYLGRWLAGKTLSVTIKDLRYEWIAEYMEPGSETVAALLICTEMFKSEGRVEPYHRRMSLAYRRHFGEIHGKTVEKIKPLLESIKIKSFFAGDVVDFIARAPGDSICVSFPPTYKGGYEKLYEKMDELFDWDRPEYVLFDDERFELLNKTMRSKAGWVTLRDTRIPDMDGDMVALVQGTMRSKPVYIYASGDTKRLVQPRQKMEDVPLERLEGEIAGKISLAKLTRGQMNSLRSEYLSREIMTSDPVVSIGVLADGKLAGALGFVASKYRSFADIYMITDLAVRPTCYPRLSKLIVAVALSTEVKLIVEQVFNMRIMTIGTSAFTDKAESMKYRGLLDLHSRKEGVLNYVGRAGKWTKEEALTWWMSKHSQKSSN